MAARNNLPTLPHLGTLEYKKSAYGFYAVGAFFVPILVCYHFGMSRDFKHYYLLYIGKHLGPLPPLSLYAQGLGRWFWTYCFTHIP